MPSSLVNCKKEGWGRYPGSDYGRIRRELGCLHQGLQLNNIRMIKHVFILSEGEKTYS